VLDSDRNDPTSAALGVWPKTPAEVHPRVEYSQYGFVRHPMAAACR